MSPDLILHLDELPTRAVVFALPVVVFDDPGGGLVPELGDITDVCRLLHGPGGMGTKLQGLYVIPQLLSSSMVANMSSRKRQSLLAALMINEVERVSLGDEASLDEQLDLASDEEDPLPLRFLVGCAFRYDDNVPVHLATKDQWEMGGLRTMVEGAMGLCLGGATDGVVHQARRPTVLAPVPLADALVEGLLEMIRQSLHVCPEGVSPEIRLLGSDDVELRIVGVEQILSIRLSTALLGAQRIEQLLNRAHVLLGGGPGSGWRGGAATH